MLSLRSMQFEEQEVVDLVRRHELTPMLLRHKLEDEITNLVLIEDSWLTERKKELLGDDEEEDFLDKRGWNANDFDLHIRRQEALKRFAEQQFGRGLEELFLTTSSNHEIVIYSLLRVKDAFMARELWIRLEENEMTFAEAASTYGEGPEASAKGIIGPVPIGRLLPSILGDILRRLQPGEIHPPKQIGEWIVLLRLEQLTPARFDESMRNQLLNEQLEEFLSKRVERLFGGEELDLLHYDQEL